MNEICRVIVVALALGAVPVMAAGLEDDPYAMEGRAMREPNNYQIRIKAGRIFTRRYDETRKMEDLNKAEQLLKEATQLQPKNNDAIARYAVAKALRARDKNDKGLAKQVLKDLDTAVGAEPQNPLYRALRGFVEVEVPADFNRMSQGLDDLKQVDAALKADPGAKTKYELDVPKIYLKLGKAYRASGNIGEAKKAWEASVAADPGSKDAAAAKRLLQKF
jgi:tetratricopeptide (TPR) repeat protein